MLGPLLFIIHINVLPSIVTSQVRLLQMIVYSRAYRPMPYVADQEAFQCDLDALERWASTWGMKLNATKCYIMNITRTRTHFTHNYSLNNHILQTVTLEKYLGITMSNDLNWSTHTRRSFPRYRELSYTVLNGVNSNELEPNWRLYQLSVRTACT